MTDIKKCTCCQLDKDVSEFGTRQRKTRKGEVKRYTSIYCKECVNAKMRLLRQQNPEVYNDNRGPKARARKDKWLSNHKTQRQEYERQYYLEHIDQFRANTQTASFKESKRVYKLHKRHHDPVFKLRDSISNAILKALKRSSSSKGGKSILQYLPYTIAELKRHLENQFNNQMTWSNHGICWHIDHIIPQSDLPYTSMEDTNFQKCWALKNLRPLEAKRNILDGARRTRHKK